ncbi:unnamed protein product [Rhizophagus irregularis]|nr:unnamed protein product [Rhizophagus irregularis]
MEFYLFQLRSNEPGFKGDGLNEPDFKGVGLNTKPDFKNEPGFKGDGLNEPDFKGVGLNTKPDFKDVGLDTNWTLRTPAWTIRREIRLLVLQGVSFLGFGTMVWYQNPVLLAMETEKLTNKPFATQLVKVNLQQ